MFRAVLSKLRNDPSPRLERFTYYIDRHIEVDGDQHGPLARQMVTQLCQNNRVFHQEAVDTALRSLRSRMVLWDGVLEEIRALKAGLDHIP
jgi:hypothetical protein